MERPGLDTAIRNEARMKPKEAAGGQKASPPTADEVIAAKSILGRYSGHLGGEARATKRTEAELKAWGRAGASARWRNHVKKPNKKKTK